MTKNIILFPPGSYAIYNIKKNNYKIKQYMNFDFNIKYYINFDEIKYNKILFNVQ